MSKRPRTDFKSIIASDVAPALAVDDTPSTQPVLADMLDKPAERRGALKHRARQQSLYLEVPVYEALREIAYTERIKMHALYLEGIDAVLKKRGLPSIAEMMSA